MKGKDDEERVVPKGTALCLHAPFGIGVQLWRDAEMIAVRDELRRILGKKAAK